MNQLEARIEQAASADRLLVACDFDGTLAEIVASPADARPLPLACAAIQQLLALPATAVAIVSGRALNDLRTVTQDITTNNAPISLFGSHGLEADDGTVIGMPRDIAHHRDALVRDFRTIAADAPGTFLEEKPYGIAVHYRELSQRMVTQLFRTIADYLDEQPGFFTKPGKQVIEVSVLPLNKGFAVDTIQNRWKPTVTIYAGDDDTDEDVFSYLWPNDIGIKIGNGPTTADYRAPSPDDFSMLLHHLARQRSLALAR